MHYDAVFAMRRICGRCAYIVGLVAMIALWNSDLSAIASSVPINKQPPIVVNVELGNDQGELRFSPDHLKFQAGKRYKLTLANESPTKHYFTSKDFADAIWSQKVDAGNVEIKGAIHELELRSHTEADWVFVPIRVGHYRLVCTVPGHAEAGMVGDIEIMG